MLFGGIALVQIRMEQDRDQKMAEISNLLGDPEQQITIGAEVEIAFEHHPDADPPHTLAQWRLK